MGDARPLELFGNKVEDVLGIPPGHLTNTGAVTSLEFTVATSDPSGSLTQLPLRALEAQEAFQNAVRLFMGLPKLRDLPCIHIVFSGMRVLSLTRLGASFRDFRAQLEEEAKEVRQQVSALGKLAEACPGGKPDDFVRRVKAAKDQVSGYAQIGAVEGRPGSLNIEYTGETDVFWDSQETVSHAHLGKLLEIEVNGNLEDAWELALLFANQNLGEES